MNRNILIGAVVLVVLFVGYSSLRQGSTSTPNGGTPSEERVETKGENVTQKAETVTLSGTYVCLPPVAGGTVTADCAFGIHTDEGEYYAVNFGAGAGSMADFRDGERITAKGTIILTKDLKPNSWAKFTSQGLFTILEKVM